MTRAVMALSVLVSHWGPGLLAKLGVPARIEGGLSFVYRMGTPGFAAVFGIGIGYFMLPRYRQDPESVRRRLTSSLRLVLIGMGLLAAVKLALVAVEGQPLDGLAVAHAFYSVLGYYALMLATARWWLGPLSRLRHPALWLVFGLPVLRLAWKLMPVILPRDQLASVLEWPRLMMVAGYNVFKMTAVASGGMLAGLWLSRQTDSRVAAGMMAAAGGSGIMLAVLSLIEAHGTGAFLTREDPVFTSLPGLVLYVSLAVAGVGVFLSLMLRWEGLGQSAAGRALCGGLQVLVVTGGLALPIYVFHELVIPGRDLLAAAGLDGALALALPMALFLGAMLLSGRRLWRMYFG